MAAQPQVGALFRRVEDAHAFIVEESPANTTRVTLELCVIKTEERETYWRLHLVDGGVEREHSYFKDVVDVYNLLEDHRRAKLAFKLTVWKTSNSSTADQHFRVGTFRRFENVFGLRVFMGGPTGNYRMRRRQGGDDQAAPTDGFEAIAPNSSGEKTGLFANPFAGTSVKSNVQYVGDDEQAASAV